MTIYTKLAKARRMLQDSKLTKSGVGYKFVYYALEDFLPRTNEIFDELGLSSFTQITREQATMVIADDDGGQITFTVPYADAILEGQAGKNPVQNLGAAITYLTRYLWVQVLAISEFDQVDGVEQTTKKATSTTNTSGGRRTATTAQNTERQQPQETQKEFETVWWQEGNDIKKFDHFMVGDIEYVTMQNKTTNELFGLAVDESITGSNKFYKF